MKKDITKELFQDEIGIMLLLFLIKERVDAMTDKDLTHPTKGVLPREFMFDVILKMVKDNLIKVYEYDNRFCLEPALQTEEEVKLFFNVN